MALNKEIIPVSIIKIIKELNNNGFEGYLVGGCVRDSLLGIEPKDWDVCTNATPEDMLKIFKNWHHYDIGLKYGTMTLVCQDGNFEVTTYRTDGEYTDNRRPDNVNFVKSLDEDLSRRDFTINALAYNPLTGEVKNKLNGIQHLAKGKLVAVGDADKRFREDALRILRALRFAINYELDIDENTLKAMQNNANLLQNVSKERITSELEKILTSGKSITHYFKKCDWLIAEIIPELKCCFDFKQNNKYHKHDVYTHILSTVDNCKTNKFEIKLAALLHDMGKPAAYTEVNGEGHFYGHPKLSGEITEKLLKERLRLTTEQYDLVLKLVKYHDILITNKKTSVKRALNKYGEAFLNDWLILKEADMADHIYDKKHVSVTQVDDVRQLLNEIVEENECFSLKNLEIDGYNLIKDFGLKQGKQIGLILNKLLDEVISDRIDNNSDKLYDRVEEIIKNNLIEGLEFRSDKSANKVDTKKKVDCVLLKTDDGTYLMRAIKSSNGASFNAEGCFRYCNMKDKSETYNKHNASKLCWLSTLLDDEKQSKDWFKYRENFKDIVIEY
ncbi:MAG: HD domain-containing protein [Lachnospiraceae bacterium]|nr:HD domain-containing protein [Lachnospiraceae bacterium]